MKNFLSGELQHFHKQNVKLNYGLLRKNHRTVELRRIEDDFIKVAQTALNKIRISRRGKRIN